MDKKGCAMVEVSKGEIRRSRDADPEAYHSLDRSSQFLPHARGLPNINPQKKEGMQKSVVTGTRAANVNEQPNA